MNTRRIAILSAVVVFTATRVVTMPCHAKIPRGYFTETINVGPTSNVAATEFIPFVSADGLTLYFSQSIDFGQQFPGSQGGEDMWFATRTNISEPFGNVINLGAKVNSAENDNIGSVSPNGLELYFGSNRTGNWELYRAARISTGDPFDDITLLGPGVNTESIEDFPRVSPDGLTLIYQTADQIQPADVDVWMASRDTTELPFDNRRRLEMNRDDVADWWPSLSADGLTLFVSDWVFSDPRPGGDGEADIWVSTRESTDQPFAMPVNLDELWPESNVNSIDIDGAVHISLDWPAPGSKIYWMGTGPSPVSGDSDIFQATWVSLDGLQAGDADQDMKFDQIDLVRVLQSAKYLTAQPATWGEGDWNGAPGGAPGNPPEGDGAFDQLDIIAALGTGLYLTGPHAAVTADDSHGANLNNDADINALNGTFGGSFSPFNIGNMVQAGLPTELALADLNVVGSLTGGGVLGDVDLVHVPEPGAALLLVIGFVVGIGARFRRETLTKIRT